MERLGAAERQLLKPEPSGLGVLQENLEECWRELCAVEMAVRAGAGAAGWRAELEEVRGRASGLAMLLDHAWSMVSGCRTACEGVYGADGSAAAAGGSVVRGLDEEG
jgi:hypothetical protein